MIDLWLIVYIRFFVFVVLALLVNLMVFAFVVQRRLSGGYPRFVMSLLVERLGASILSAIV